MIKQKRFKKVSFCLAMLLVLMSFNINVLAGVQITDYEVESNNTHADANKITLATPFRGRVSDSNDVDFFSYEPDENKIIDFIFIDNAGVTFDIYILDKTANNLIEAKSVSGLYQTVYYFKDNHEYIIKVSSNQGNNALYEISITGDRHKTISTLEDSKEIEYNGEAFYANKLPNADWLVSGSIFNVDDDDYFKFTPNKSGNMDFIFYPGTSANFYIFVYDNTAGLTITSANISNPGSSEVIPFFAYSGHEYQVYITASGSSSSINDEGYHFKCWYK